MEENPGTRRRGVLAKGQRVEPKLDADAQLFVVKMLAQWKSPRQVAALVQAQYGIPFSEMGVYRYLHAEKWKPMLLQFRQSYVTNLADVAISQKRIRLERLEQQYQDIQADESYTKERDRRGELRLVLTAARREMEETKGGDTNLVIANFSNLSNEELEERKQALLKRLLKPRRPHALDTDGAVVREGSTGQGEVGP